MTLQMGRHLDIEGAYNVRDLGGYKTADGHSTRWRTLVRADDVSRLPEASRSALLIYGVRTVIDLRNPRELEISPNRFAHSGDVSYVHVHLQGTYTLAAQSTSDQSLPMPTRLSSIYITWLEKRQEEFARVLSTLASPGSLPALYHCLGGKDRTGIVSALLLRLARVPNETVVEDYTLTAEYRVNGFLKVAESPELPRGVLGQYDPPAINPDCWSVETYRARFCPPEVMSEMLAYIDQRYGDVEGYIRAIGLTDEQVEFLRIAIVE